MKLKTKRALLSSSIALSAASLMAFNNPAYSETLVVQAENFSNSGGSYPDGQPNPVGVYSLNGAGAINFVNAGDYVDYNVNTAGGEFSVTYSVGTSVASGPAIEFLVNQNGSWVSQGTVGVPLGSWDDFQPLTPNHTVTLPAGASTVRLHAMGSDWQWNMDSFTLTSTGTPTPTPTPAVADVVVELENFTSTNKEGSAVAGDTERGFGRTSTGINYNTSGDYADYSVSFPSSGVYRVSIDAGSPVTGQIGAQLIYGGQVVANSYLSATAGWDNYMSFDLSGDVAVGAGTHSFRLQSIGSSTWQWNGDKITFEYIREGGGVTPTPTPIITPTPTPSGGLHLKDPIAIPQSEQVRKSEVWYTYPQNANMAGFGNFGATGAFWGHMPEHDFYDDNTINGWVAGVDAFRNQGFDYVGRGEFDWGFRWFTEYTGNPEPHYVRTLDNNVVVMSFMGNLSYNGYPNGWISNHSPEFVPFFKTQVDNLLKANVSHIMFDTQTSSTRSTHMNQFGGDFSTWAMDAFRGYMRGKYSAAELRALGISNINTFNYRDFLINRGYTHQSYMAQANTISGGVPLMDDFIYFNRDVFNEKFAEVLNYLRSRNPTIEVGATTTLFEARGYLFNENITFLAGELAMNASGNQNEMPTNIIAHLKGAEAVDKTLAYFPYPWDFANLYERNAARHARTWIAQSYAMGAIFSIPANVWIGDPGVWAPGPDNYRDLYQFARAQENLLDGYDAYSKVALVSPVMASLDEGWIDGSGNLKGSIASLIHNNINFDLMVFGDPGYPVVPKVEDFAKYDAVIYDNDNSYLTSEQSSYLESNADNLVNINNIGPLKADNISVQINGAAADATVTAVSRVHETNAGAPYVVHLLNRPLSNNGVTPIADNVTVAIPQDYFAKSVTSATLHLPDGTSQQLSTSANANGDTTVTVNDLGVWGILELGH